MENVKLNTIEEAIEDFKAGNFVIVVDDSDLYSFLLHNGTSFLLCRYSTEKRKIGK